MEDRDLRPSRNAAVTAWLLALTSLWLAWWRVRFHDPAGQVIDTATSRLYVPGLFVQDAWVWIATGLVTAAVVVLFVRIAGQSWQHEPAAWQRDIMLSGIMVAAALLSAFAWPAGDDVAPTFWGGVDFTTNDTAGTFTVTTGPGLGWWMAILSAVALGVSTWLATRSK